MRYKFDEISFRNQFIDALKEIFANEYDTLQTEVEVLDNENQKSTFPCCVVSIINPLSNGTYDDSEGSFQKITLSLNIDFYSKKLDNFSLTDSVIKLSQIALNGLLIKYPNIIITRNSNVPYRVDALRRTITGRMLYDVQNNIIYSN